MTAKAQGGIAQDWSIDRRGEEEGREEGNAKDSFSYSKGAAKVQPSRQREQP